MLVYDRTGSGLVTAAVYALTFLPALAGSVLLGPLADRLPRRGLLVGGDLIRAALLAAMALPALSVPVLSILLVATVLVGTPWKAAASALVVDILTVEDYPTGLGLRTATGQAAQIAGFAIGGIAIAAIGARRALALGAATFLISAVVIRLGVRTRPPAAHPDDAAPGPPQRWLHGAATVLADRRLRLLLSLAWLLGLLVIPEGLAAHYAQHLGGGARTVGLLLAAGPFARGPSTDGATGRINLVRVRSWIRARSISSPPMTSNPVTPAFPCTHRARGPDGRPRIRCGTLFFKCLYPW